MAVLTGVVEWAESNWIVPETQRLIVLKPWQKAVLLAMFPPDGSASPFETFLLSTVKKGGKTTLNAIGSYYAALTLPAPETTPETGLLPRAAGSARTRASK